MSNAHDELRILMLKDQKVREIIGLYEQEKASADRLEKALVAIRDGSVNVAAIAEEALS